MPGWAAAEAALKQAGLIYSTTGPDEVHISEDVLFSLRYSGDGHIARELGEPPSAGPAHNISGPRCRGQAGYPRVSTRAGPVDTRRGRCSC